MMGKLKRGRTGRKVWTILLAVLLVLTMTPAAAFADGEAQYRYVGSELSKTYDSQPVKVRLDQILTTDNRLENAPLYGTSLYGKYVTAKWYKLVDEVPTEISGSGTEEGENYDVYALYGPSDPGTYQFVLVRPEEWASEEIMLTIPFTITAAEETPVHNHAFSANWTNDTENHWHACNCGEKQDVSTHSFSEWQQTQEASSTESRSCTICDYKQYRVSQTFIEETAPVNQETGNLTISTQEENQQQGDNSVNLSAASFGSINTIVSNQENNVNGLSVTCGTNASAAYDAQAVSIIQSAVQRVIDSGASAADITVTFTIEPQGDEEGMTTAQQSTVAGTNDATVFHIAIEITVTTGSGTTTSEVSDFNGGSANITVPYTPTGEGEVTVKRVNDNGTTTEMPSTYNANEGTVTWTTGTHSFYMIQTKAQSGTGSGNGSGSGAGSGSGSGSGSIYWPPTTQQPAEPESPETPETPEPTKSDIQASLDGQNLVARSQLVTMKNGKKAIKVTWADENGEMMDFDGVEIFRSTKRGGSYGKKPIFETRKKVYYNTAIKPGTRYYYKIRGYVEFEGEKLYTGYSKKAWRTVN